ncbi:hypothetical protein OfM2_13010 [Lactovum odontotermitis]
MVSSLKEYDLMVLKVVFDDGTGYKARPAIVIKANDEEIAFFRITSQYEKSQSTFKINILKS